MDSFLWTILIFITALVLILIVASYRLSPTSSSIYKINEIEGCSIYHHDMAYGGSTFAICHK